MKKTYYEKLRDPRWQKKRLEVMHSAGFECEDCGSSEKTLNVHHVRYIKGREPWEYSRDELQCLCEDCHNAKHEKMAVLLDLVHNAQVPIEQIIGYCVAHAGPPIFYREYYCEEFAVGYAQGNSTCSVQDACALLEEDSTQP